MSDYEDHLQDIRHAVLAALEQLDPQTPAPETLVSADAVAVAVLAERRAICHELRRVIASSAPPIAYQTTQLQLDPFDEPCSARETLNMVWTSVESTERELGTLLKRIVIERRPDARNACMAWHVGATP